MEAFILDIGLVAFYLFFSFFYNVIYDATFPIKQLVGHDKQSEWTFISLIYLFSAHKICDVKYCPSWRYFDGGLVSGKELVMKPEHEIFLRLPCVIVIN